MNKIKGSFDDFDFFKEAVNDWNLDFNIISKGDFNARFHIFSSKDFLLSRETLQGTIEHRGFSPLGYRTIVIPINYGNELTWYQKRLPGKELLIFPKNPAIDVTTYNGLDIFLLSIKEDVLSKIITENNFENCKNAFDGQSKEIPVNIKFTEDFFDIADKFMNTKFTDDTEQHSEIKKIALFLLNHIEENKHNTIDSPSNKQHSSINKAIELIHDEEGELIPVQELCKMVGVSEKTLFNAFKERFKASPNEYIKAIRLNKVKKEIFADEDSNISTLAGKYHFWHMGQFAKDFKNQFGFLPSEVNSKNK